MKSEMKATGLMAYATTHRVVNLLSLGGTRVLEPDENGMHIDAARSKECRPAHDTSLRLLRSPSQSLANRGDDRDPEVPCATAIAARLHGRGGLPILTHHRDRLSLE
jgi:hypothetical protein